MLNRRILILIFVCANFCCDVSALDFWSGFSSYEETSDPIVTTTAGKLQGKFIENPKFNVKFFSFKGIPYAEPPIGKLRFKAPISHAKWEGVRNAFEHGTFCANRWGFFFVNYTVGGSEDCLFLNVYTPSLDGPKKAVMFFIHGGSFMSGSGNSDIYGPDHLVKKDIVLVTINYRLSAFGFMSTGDEHAPGNQGLKDIVLALQWVQENIENFGGDKEQVTIFGHSAGSIVVHHLLMSDSAKNLFKQAILQSGTAFMKSTFQPNNPYQQAQKLAHRLNIKHKDSKDLVEKLQAVPFEDIVNVESPLNTMGWSLSGRLEFVPSIEPKNENAFLTETPIKRMMDGNFHKVPIMIGDPNFVESLSSILSILNNNQFNFMTNDNELKIKPKQATNCLKNLNSDGGQTGNMLQWLNIYSNGDFKFCDDRLVKFYAKSSPHPVYYYEFAFDGNMNFFKKHMNLTDYDGVGLFDEIFYLFEPYESEFEFYVPDAIALLMRERMTTMWTNFAKFGNPTPVINEIITEKWKPYTISNENYYEINFIPSNRHNPTRIKTLNELQRKFGSHF